MVYTHTAWKVFTRLYAELKEGPAAWQEYVTNLEHLIQITKRISYLSERAQLSASGQIATLVCESRNIAEKALYTVAKANTKIFGIRWYSIGITEILNRAFESLKAKREILLLALSHENLVQLASISRGYTERQRHLEDATMDQNAASKEVARIEPTPTLEIEMTSKQVGNGSTMVSNNGLGHILERINGSVKLSTSSVGDRVVVNSNNVYMEPDVIKKQLEIAEIYARDHAGAQQRENFPISGVRAKSVEPKQDTLALEAP
ncbi:uncharacterized protein N0V89_002934 [Didymosphaeria variabile]|uniref:Uncharacterized protein n=1 Tax=Didymosphaeria variabile TaxID=1932322 RepID=A0A9W8XVQ6_9PLEO|nr:uncharacterized protein N0V89_002934 [Didymosphaeria variabile]KAJ4358352.1 hypothetical protein N0V89_002934 [Didymosphaeria variabile]